MDRRKFSIVANELKADKTYRLLLKTCDKSELTISAGQFVDIAIPGFYLRRPIAVCDYKGDELTLYYKTVGEGTKQMATMRKGEELDLLVALGHGFDAAACESRALLVGGGLGCGAMYLLCKELLALGKEVKVVQCFNTASDVILNREFKDLGVETVLATVDGSAGVRGFALDAIAEQNWPGFDRFYCCGPMMMMRSICFALNIPGEASLEERMGCGAGYCYGCSCKTILGAKRVCADGPVFRKEEIIW